MVGVFDGVESRWGGLGENNKQTPSCVPGSHVRKPLRHTHLAQWHVVHAQMFFVQTQMFVTKKQKGLRGGKDIDMSSIVLGHPPLLVVSRLN